jgi:CBS domain-containing protein
MNIEECMALMTASRCRHMPVFENDHLIGVVSIGDVVNAIIQDQKITIRNLEDYISMG